MKEPPILTRMDAISQGLNRYFDGKPCRNGHISEKYVRKNYCCECKIISENRNAVNRSAYKKRAYNLKRKDIIHKNKQYCKLNNIKVKQYQKQWRERNCENIVKYRTTNAGLYAYHASLRRKSVKMATPPWAEFDKIRELYKLAADMTRNSGIIYHVDHIIPLKNELVCGLHCIDNLQIITQYENLSKHNKFNNIS